MEQYFKVAAMACAVLAPFAILSSVALWELDRNVRTDIERTIGGRVDACLVAIEREIERHAAVLDAFAGTETSLDQVDGPLPGPSGPRSRSIHRTQRAPGGLLDGLEGRWLDGRCTGRS